MRPVDLAEAVTAIAAGAVPLAGGTILVPAIHSGQALPAEVIDVARLPGLAGIKTSSGGLTIGAATTLAELAGAVLPAGERALVEAAQVVANPFVRRPATLGGNAPAPL